MSMNTILLVLIGIALGMWVVPKVMPSLSRAV